MLNLPKISLEVFDEPDTDSNLPRNFSPNEVTPKNPNNSLDYETNFKLKPIAAQFSSVTTQSLESLKEVELLNISNDVEYES